MQVRRRRKRKRAAKHRSGRRASVRLSGRRSGRRNSTVNRSASRNANPSVNSNVNRSGSLSASPLAHPAGNGNLSNVSNWKPFNAKSGYHGELFLDPDSGVVLRTIIQAEFKPSDFVHYEDIRVDYAPMPVGDKNLYVPVRSFTIAEIVPNGDSYESRYADRLQLVTQDFKDIQAAGATTAQK